MDRIRRNEFEKIVVEYLILYRVRLETGSHLCIMKSEDSEDEDRPAPGPAPGPAPRAPRSWYNVF